MIQLTRLNKQPLMVNPELIKFVEASPDTVITLVGGEKMVVLESAEVVARLIFSYRVALGRSVTSRVSDHNGANSAPDETQER